jgi:thioredoxin 1
MTGRSSTHPLAEVTAATFDELVLDADGPVLVDFWAEWCPPCRALRPMLEEIAVQHPRLTVLALDADADPDLAVRYRAMALPVMKVFEAGEVVKTIIGARPRHILENELRPYF